MKDLDGLIAKVEAATAPDRKLDVLLHATFFPDSFDGSADHYAAVGYLNAADRRWLDSFVPFYGTTMDAAVALIDLKLPGAWWIMAKGRVRAGEPLHAAQLFAEGHNPFTSLPLAEGEHELLPLAIILATLRALQSLPEGDVR